MKRGTKTLSQKTERKYLPEFVYGGMDGSITTFAVISGVIGASLSSSVVLILGFANLFADGFSMSISNYISTKSRNETSNGPKMNEYKTSLATFFSFILIGFIPLISFVLASVTNNPLLVEKQFEYSFILTGLAFVTVGWFKGIITKKHKVKSVLQTFIIGGVASLLAFGVGRFISTLIN